MSKRKTTVYLDEELLRAARVFAARTGIRDSEVVERALRAYLGIETLEQIWARSDLSEEEAVRLAYEAVHESRKSAGVATEWPVGLTDREMEVLALLAFGSTLREIAERLNTSEDALTQMLSSAAEKLDQSSRGAENRAAPEEHSVRR